MIIRGNNMSKEMMLDVYEEVKNCGGNDESLDWENIKKRLRRTDDEPLIYLYYDLQDREVNPAIRLLSLYVGAELMMRRFSLRAQEVYKDEAKIEKPSI